MSAEATPSPSLPSSNDLGSSSSSAAPALQSMIQSVTDSKAAEAAASNKPQSPKPFAQPNSFSEWQLLAVLQRANLLQYYEVFLEKGGDDINQLMQSDETEFLEIMAIVGMVNKPLHVRRLQRSLTEFCKDQTAFNLQAMQNIGAPPPPPQFTGSSDPMSYLMPGLAATLSGLTSTSPGLNNGETDASSATGQGSNQSVELAGQLSDVVFSTMASGSVGGTANVLSGAPINRSYSNPTTTCKEKERSPSPLSVSEDFLTLGDCDPNSTIEPATLNDPQLQRIILCAQNLVEKLPVFQPKLIQNKKKITQEVLDLITMPTDSVNRVEAYRKYSAIYGRFDTKRKPNKVLSLHEQAINEAASQLCMMMPTLLTRRDELFTLSRQVVRNAGYNYHKRRRPADSNSPNPFQAFGHNPHHDGNASRSTDTRGSPTPSPPDPAPDHYSSASLSSMSYHSAPTMVKPQQYQWNT